MANSGAFSVNFKVVGMDEATKEIDKLNKEMMKAQAPAKAYEKAIKKYEDLSGLTKQKAALKKADEEHRASVKKTMESISGLGDSLVSVAGDALKASGAILGLGALGTVAGILDLAKNFGQNGVALRNMSQNLGISTNHLLNLHNAAEKVGVSAGDLDSVFHSIGQSTQDAVSGRNPALYAYMKGVLHLDPTQKKFLAKSGVEQSQEIFAAISKLSDPRLRENALNMFGAGGALPIVNNLQAYQNALQSTAHDSRANTEEAIKLYSAFTDLSQATGQLGRDVIDVLGPSLTPFIGTTTHLVQTIDDWIEANKNLIQVDIDSWLRPIQDDFDRFSKWLAKADFQTVSDDVTMLAHALEFLAGIKLVAWGAQLASVFTGISASFNTMLLDSPLLKTALLMAQVYQKSQEGVAPSPELFKNVPAMRGVMTRPGDAVPSIFKNNNPTNLSAFPGQPYATGANGRWATYANQQDGIAGGLYQMLLDQEKGYDTITKEITKRSPPNENPTAEMIATISRNSGLDPNAPLNLYDPDVAKRFLSADIKRETGKDADAQSLDNAVKMAYSLAHGDGLKGAENAGVGPTADPSGSYARAQANALAQSNSITGGITANVNINGAPAGSSATATTTGSAFKSAPMISLGLPSYVNP